MDTNLFSAATLRNELTTQGFLELPDFFTTDQFALFHHSIHEAKETPSFSLGLHAYTLLAIPKPITSFLHSPGFQSLLTSLTKNPVSLHPLLLRFTKGDYTLLHDTSLPGPFTGILDFSDTWKEAFGGYISFICNNTELFRKMPRKNSLFLFSLPENTRFFVKYINSLAKDKEACFLFF